MKTLKRSLTTPFQSQLSKGFFIFLFVTALVGFADASYLTVEHYAHQIPPCAIGSCETVLSSSYSVVAGVPVALGGALYYLTILVLLMLYRDTKNEKILRAALAFTLVGFLFSVYFFIIQAFVLHAFCQYCLGSAFTSTTLFIVAIVIFKKYSPQEIAGNTCPLT